MGEKRFFGISGSDALVDRGAGFIAPFTKRERQVLAALEGRKYPLQTRHVVKCVDQYPIARGNRRTHAEFVADTLEALRIRGHVRMFIGGGEGTNRYKLWALSGAELKGVYGGTNDTASA